MGDYFIRILSFAKHELGDVCGILSLPVIRRVLFPARLPLPNGDALPIETLERFAVSMVPQEAFMEDFVGFPLYADNGMRLSFTLGFHESSVPDVVGLYMTSEHFRNGTIGFSDIKALLEQTIPVFRADHATVFDAHISLRRSPMYFVGPDLRHYPSELGWFTYFGPALVSFMGRERFKRVSSPVELYDLYHGMLVILQQEPFDGTNPAHRHRQRQAEKELGLRELLR